MKNIVKIVISVILLFVVGISIIFLLPKNNKIVRNPVKLNYDLTYEEAFPDKEFRRLILTMLFRNKEYVYNGANYYYYNNFYGALKYTYESYSGISNDSALDDNGLETFSKKKIDKNLLDQVKIIHANKEAETFKNISSLQGIEYFPNLQVLVISGTKLKEADFSNNLELETLFLPEQFYDSSGNSNITGASLLEKINIKNNSKLVNLVLNLNPNKENNIDLSGNPKLKSVFIEKSNLKSIDLTNKPYLEESNINLKGNRLQEIKSDKTNPHFTFGSTDQVIKLTVDKLEKVKIPLKVNNKDLYLNDSPDFTRDNDTYIFNKVGVNTYSFYDNSSLYGGTVEVTVTGGEAKNYKPIVNTNNKVYVGENFTYSSIIANYPPKTSIDQELDNSSKGLKTVKFTSFFSDGSQVSYEVQIPVFEKIKNQKVDAFQTTNRKSEYIEGNLSKTQVLSYSEPYGQREDYLNILRRKNKCNYENFTCQDIEYNLSGYYSVGSLPTLNHSDRGVGKFGEYDTVNNIPILESKVKVYNSKQMEQVVRNYDNGNQFLDWKNNEEEKKYYIYPSDSTGYNNVLETTILRDTDGDGIPDKEDDDDDNDGISDAQETIDGTNPKDKNDFKVKKICYKINA